jgi:hypothetical protein
MSKQAANIVEGGAMSDQYSSSRVPEEVRAPTWSLHAELVDRTLADAANARGAQGPVGRLDAQEHLLVLASLPYS